MSNFHPLILASTGVFFSIFNWSMGSGKEAEQLCFGWISHFFFKKIDGQNVCYSVGYSFILWTTCFWSHFWLFSTTMPHLRSTESKWEGWEMEIFIFKRVPGGPNVQRNTLIRESSEHWFKDLRNSCKMWTKDTKAAFNVKGYKYYIRHVETGWIYSV